MIHARSRLLKLITFFAIVALATVGCAEQDITTEPDEPAGNGEQTQPADEGTSPEAAEGGEEEEKQAAVGDSITLEGNEEGVQLAVTVQEVLNPAEAAEEFMAPDEGEKLVAVRLQLENTGDSNYQDSPGNGATLITDANESFSHTFTEVQDCQSFADGQVTMAPGDTAVGCLAFELPQDANPARFQFALDSGFGPQTGVWTING